MLETSNHLLQSQRLHVSNNLEKKNLKQVTSKD